jgi:uncharacterized membrane protein
VTTKHSLVEEVSRLGTIEQQVIDRFIHRQRALPEPPVETASFGDRVADRVAAFGGSWRFIIIAVGLIAAWMLFNQRMTKAFDPFPYILLNLVLSCLAALQAPVIMMSQNRQAARDREQATQDYEVNTKAELEIVALGAKLDELRTEKWIDLMKAQEQQLELLAKLTSKLQ